MADKCAGCFNKFRMFEKPTVCPSCRRNFCSTCLPAPHKKKGRPHRETCVYCTKKTKQIIQEEEAEIMETFQERFYKHTHTESPIQTRTQLDYSKIHQDGEGRVQPQLSEEDKKLEERLRALRSREDGSKHSEDEIRDKLDKLRGEERKDATSPAGSSGSQNKTAFDEAQDLFKAASEETRLDEKLAETNLRRDKELSSRLDALKGRESLRARDDQHADVELQKFLEGMEIEISHESPQELLEDLKTMEKEVSAPRHEEGAEGLSPTITPYPVLPDEMSTADPSGVNESEIQNLMEGAAAEIIQDREAEKQNAEFIHTASEQLARLRGEDTGSPESDCVVRSKSPGHKDRRSDSLKFTWEHFGATPASKGLLAGGDTLASRQLGITVSMGEATDDDVAVLLEQMMEEAILDRKLELSGYRNEGSEQPEQSASEAARPSRGAANYDDLPWCCICNDDASIRCYDCDDDLYCPRCFSEGHENFGLYEHRYAPFEPPNAN